MKRIVPYGSALALVAASLAARWILTPFFGPTVPYLQFFPAIVIASWFWGFGPGALATVASAAAAVTLMLPATESAADLLSLFLFTAIGLVIAALNGRLNTSDQSTRRESALAIARAERLSAIINTTVDGIIVIDGRGRIEAFNAGAQRLFGYGEDEVIGENVKLLMPEPYHGEHDGYLHRYHETGVPAIIGTGRQVRGRRKDGSVFPLHLSVGEMTVAGERKFTGMLHDLTARVALEEQLRSSEERWRAVIDSATDGIIVIDPRGHIETFNPAAIRLFGYEAADVVGQNVKLLMPSPYHEQLDDYLTRYLATGAPPIIGSGREVTGRRKDGSTFPLHLSVGEAITGGERRFTGIVHDLTARVALEAQLREQGAMARLGEMAAVLAHEIKNPLAGIRGAVQVIGGRLPAGSSDAPIMKEIVSRIDSLDDMMRQLLLFSRTPQPKRRAIEIIPLVQITADLLKRDQASLRIVIEITGSAPPVQADPEMLKMVIQNVLINAAHAIEGSGTIRVGVEAVDFGTRISIADDGPGIPIAVRDKIFQPFFTTKARGTGLGLPTAKRFIEAHRGRVAVECPASGGTTIILELPND